jgi:hypothetical protein
MKRDEFATFLLGHFREYEARYGQPPSKCYCPAPIFDQFLQDARDEFLNGPITPQTMDPKQAFFFAGRPSYVTVYGVQVLRASQIQQLDFNIPEREDIYCSVQ